MRASAIRQNSFVLYIPILTEIKNKNNGLAQKNAHLKVLRHGTIKFYFNFNEFQVYVFIS
jgi:hypothetical protein